MATLYFFPPNDNTPKKTCTGPCGRILPTACFHRNRTRKGELADQCKECAKCKKNSAKLKPPQDLVAEGNKRCTGPCKKEYPATTEFFYQYKTSRDGLGTRCKACIKDYQSRPETRKRICANRSRPEVQVKYSTYRHNRRAYKKSVKGTHTSEQLQEQLKRQKNKCYYCQKLLQKVKGKYTYHVDHTFPLSRVAGTDIPANSIDYIVLTCPACNLSKGDKYPWEWPEGGRLL